MRAGQTLEIEATVNATATEMVLDLNEQSQSIDLVSWFSEPMDYWMGMDLTIAFADPVRSIARYAEDYLENRSRGEGQEISSQRTVSPDSSCWCGIVIPKNRNGLIWNTCFVMTSGWNKTNNETFDTFAQGYHAYYQQYLAKWRVTHSAVMLSSATPLHRFLAQEKEEAQAGTIEHNYSSMQNAYIQPFVDYDWKYSGEFKDYARPISQNAAMYTDTTLVASMIWSKLTTSYGMANPFFNETDSFRRYKADSTGQMTTPTLKQSKILALVLAIDPLVLLCVLVVRVLCLSRAPISEDFGFAALLGGIDYDSLQMTRGAAYSGKLKRDLRLVFTVLDDDSCRFAESSSNPRAQRYGTVRINLARFSRRDFTFARNDTIKRDVIYGSLLADWMLRCPDPAPGQDRWQNT